MRWLCHDSSWLTYLKLCSAKRALGSSCYRDTCVFLGICAFGATDVSNVLVLPFPQRAPLYADALFRF